jgi:hypothetical protein
MNWYVVIPALSLLLIAAGGIALYRQMRTTFASKKKLPSAAYSEITRDWKLTGRINFTGPIEVMTSQSEDISALFYIQVEENRVVNDIGGGEYMESRWRLPTRSEVKEIVRLYNSIRLPSTGSKYGLESMIGAGEKSTPGIESETKVAITDTAAKS